MEIILMKFLRFFWHNKLNKNSSGQFFGQSVVGKLENCARDCNERILLHAWCCHENFKHFRFHLNHRIYLHILYVAKTNENRSKISRIFGEFSEFQTRNFLALKFPQFIISTLLRAYLKWNVILVNKV